MPQSNLEISIHEFEFICLMQGVSERYTSIVKALRGGSTLSDVARHYNAPEGAFRLAYEMVKSSNLNSSLAEEKAEVFRLDSEISVTHPQPIVPASTETCPSIATQSVEFTHATEVVHKVQSSIQKALRRGATLTQLAKAYCINERVFRLAYAQAKATKRLDRLTAEYANLLNLGAEPNCRHQLATPPAFESSAAKPLNPNRPFLVIAAADGSLNRDKATFSSCYQLVVTSAGNSTDAAEGATALNAGMLRVGAFDAAELRRLADLIESHQLPPGKSYNLSTQQTDEQAKAYDEYVASFFEN